VCHRGPTSRSIPVQTSRQPINTRCHINPKPTILFCSLPPDIRHRMEHRVKQDSLKLSSQLMTIGRPFAGIRYESRPRYGTLAFAEKGSASRRSRPRRHGRGARVSSRGKTPELRIPRCLRLRRGSAAAAAHHGDGQGASSATLARRCRAASAHRAAPRPSRCDRQGDIGQNSRIAAPNQPLRGTCNRDRLSSSLSASPAAARPCGPACVFWPARRVSGRW